MKLEDQVCSLELAKRLKELGVRQESAFYWVWNIALDKLERISFFKDTASHKFNKGKIIDSGVVKYYAAFTVAEIGEMLPLWYYSKRIPDGSWSTDHVSRMDILNTNEKTEADSRAAMLIQIIERKIERL